MALFRRNKVDQTGMPPEIQSYYQTENRERTWLAWLMALGTLLVTVVVVLGVFFWRSLGLSPDQRPRHRHHNPNQPRQKQTG